MTEPARTVGAHAVAIALVAACGISTGWDLAVVALAVVLAALLVGGVVGERTLAHMLLFAGLVTVTVVAGSGVAALPQTVAPWAVPLGAAGVWVGADFRRSIEEIAARGRR